MQGAGQADAAQAARLQSLFATQFFDIAEPSIKMTLQDAIKDLGKPGQEPQSVQTAFDTARGAVNTNFAAEKERDVATLTQLAKQSGTKANIAEAPAAAENILFDLEKGRRGSLRQLKEQEIDASVAQRDFDLSTIFGIGQGAFGSSLGYLGSELNVDKLIGPGAGAGALSGALSGASIGTSISPGWGTLIGAAGGAALGYFTSSGGGG